MADIAIPQLICHFLKTVILATIWSRLVKFLLLIHTIKNCMYRAMPWGHESKIYFLIEVQAGSAKYNQKICLMCPNLTKECVHVFTQMQPKNLNPKCPPVKTVTLTPPQFLPIASIYQTDLNLIKSDNNCWNLSCCRRNWQPTPFRIKNLHKFITKISV